MLEPPIRIPALALGLAFVVVIGGVETPGILSTERGATLLLTEATLPGVEENFEFRFVAVLNKLLRTVPSHDGFD